MKKPFFLLLLAVTAFTSCQSQNSAAEDETVLSVEAYQEKLSASEDVQLLDVRTPREYEAGHIEGAVNINYFDEDFLSQVEQRFKKGETVMLYCRSGSRSTKAKAIMKKPTLKKSTTWKAASTNGLRNSQRGLHLLFDLLGFDRDAFGEVHRALIRH